jgi:hypothetical protein
MPTTDTSGKDLGGLIVESLGRRNEGVASFGGSGADKAGTGDKAEDGRGATKERSEKRSGKMNMSRCLVPRFLVRLQWPASRIGGTQ